MGSDQTRSYARSESVVFLKTNEAFGGLSNMAGGFPLQVNGLRIFTAEALYQACRFPHRPEVQRLIVGQASPMTAKMKSKPYRHDSRPDWDQVRVKIMRWSLRVKLAQNWVKFSDLLLATGDRPIVEESRKDDFWGAKPIDEYTLVGTNVLGRLLMELREAVKNEEHNSLLRVESLAIPDFLLDGHPIQTVSVEGVERRALIPPITERREQAITTTTDATQPTLFEQPAVKDAPAPYLSSGNGQVAAIAGLKPYPVMKNSGVPWLGEVPSHWDVLPNRALFSEIKERDRTDEQMLSVTITQGIIKQRALLSDSSKKDSSNQDKSAYKLVCPGDIAYNKMRAWQGAVGVSDHRGIVSPAYVIQRPREGADSRYFHHLLRTPAFAKEAERWSYGITSDMWSLRPEHFKMIYCSLPSKKEQSAIVRFLDHADRRIRRYIRAKQKLIKLLEEQKQAIIHRAVTRGLDPDVRLKPSGVEWLVDVPERWQVRKLGQIAVSFRTGPFGSSLHQSDYIEGGTPVINPTHMSCGRIVEDPRCSVPHAVADRLKVYRLERHDVVFSRRGELGRCALVRDREAGWLCGTGSIRVRVAYDDIEPEYLIQSLQVRWIGEYLSLFSVGATMDSLNTGILKEIPVLVPPIDEQRALLAQIVQEGRRIDSGAASTEREILLLREYRTRLIADVVTGKLDVRDVAACLPNESAEPQVLDDADALAEGDEPMEADLDDAPEEAKV